MHMQQKGNSRKQSITAEGLLRSYMLGSPVRRLLSTLACVTLS